MDTAQIRVEYFYDPESNNWGFEVPSLGIIGGAETRETAEQQAVEAIAFALESEMEATDSSSQRVLVLGHGSRRSRTTATDTGIREIACRLQARFPGGPVIRPAFFDFLSPSLAEAVRQAAHEGVTEIAVLPYFLFAGKEIQLEIPQELERLGAELPQVTIRQLPHLGVDARLATLVAQRVREALQGTSQYLPAHGLVRRNAAGRLGVLLVSRGSRPQWDPGTDLARLGELARRELGGDTLMAVAQAENSERTIELAAAELAALGARRIVVVPYLHFIGKVLIHNIIPALERSRQAHAGIVFALAWTLCVNDAAIDLLEDRVRATGFAGAPRLAAAR
ncbi:MAG TPA: CbiX/SirB N-terminal domain-containing protein [Chloroflexota bacterium]|nr:CbiX/SirB N-terminal domain-containing protein [Chloroflexota bacterium]